MNYVKDHSDFWTVNAENTEKNMELISMELFCQVSSILEMYVSNT